MDQSKLDPKLKEAYDRVMGFSSPVKIQSAKTTAAPALPTTPPPFKPLSSFAPQPGQTVVMRAVSTGNAPAPVTAPTSSGEKVKISEGSAQVTKGKSLSGNSSFTTILLFLVAVVFFAVYTIFWLKFFSIKLPFALPF